MPLRVRLRERGWQKSSGGGAVPEAFPTYLVVVRGGLGSLIHSSHGQGMARDADNSDRDVAPGPAPRRRRLWKVFVPLGLIGVPVLGFALWTWITLNYTYSRGERAGYVQKVSEKGWLCKTWEGELAMANLPGAMPEIFHFSVRDDSIAHAIDRAAGQRVSLAYEQHRGVPTSCFGETEYYVTGVRVIGNGR
jgi:hypothetical protein